MPEVWKGVRVEGESPASPEHRVRHAAQVFLQSLRIQDQPQGRSRQAHAARAPEIAVELVLRRNVSSAPAETRSPTDGPRQR